LSVGRTPFAFAWSGWMRVSSLWQQQMMMLKNATAIHENWKRTTTTGRRWRRQGTTPPDKTSTSSVALSWVFLLF
jgi:hypothetical protein